MKKFRFSLARMLNFQQQNFNKEQNLMSQLIEERTEYEKQKEELQKQMEQLHIQMDQEMKRGTTVFQISTYTSLLENGKHQIEILKDKIKRMELEVERQRQVVMEASREVTKLEKLRDKKLEEYHYAQAKAEEEMVSEFVSSQFVRQSVF